MLKADVARSIERVASVHGIDPTALKAVVEVESNGVVFADIDGKDIQTQLSQQSGDLREIKVILQRMEKGQRP